jgi:N6-L-threonylcarbamoyladenine synthase
MHKSKNPNFSFSGLKTAFNQIAMKNKLNKKIISDLSASIQKSITDCLIDRTRLGITKFRENLGNISNIQLVVSGGVAANLHIREELKKLCLETDSTFFAPPLNLCTDNGAMIAWAGYEKYNNEGESNLNFKPRPRWPLDPNAHLINPIHQNIGKSGAKA